MADRSRSAFTLVELLVVVVIIALLMGLLLPAVIGARAGARRTECTNNQHELALAVAQYENAKDRFPGYINDFGRVRDLSWVVAIFPYLSQPELWDRWRDPNRTVGTKYTSDLVSLPQLICPSDSRSESGALSYVANCGLSDAITIPNSSQLLDRPAYGVFFNGTGRVPDPNGVQAPVLTQTSDQIPDGAANTVMLSENVHATRWAPEIDANPTNWVHGPTWFRTDQGDWREANVGMVWWPDSIYGDAALADLWECCDPNKCVKDAPTDLHVKYARPASRHPGGVVVTYCDGRQVFENDEDFHYPPPPGQETPSQRREQDIYRQKMIPDDGQARTAGLIP